MCRSKAEGGQRCYGHALASYEKVRDQVMEATRGLPDTAVTRARQAPGVSATADESLNRARVTLASTKQGLAQIEYWRQPGDNPDRRALEAMWGKNDDAINDYLDRVIAQGKETTKVNEEVRRLTTSRVARFQNRAKRLAEEFAGNWSGNGGLVFTSAATAYNAAHSTGMASVIYAGTSAVALGVVAYLTWKGARYHRWEHTRDAAQTTLPKRQLTVENGEQVRIQETFNRDVQRGAATASDDNVKPHMRTFKEMADKMLAKIS